MKITYKYSQQEIEQLIAQSSDEVRNKPNLKFSWNVQENRDAMDRPSGGHIVQLSVEFDEPLQKPITVLGD